MKNLLLAAAFSAVALSVNAQDEVNNLVFNGDFENKGYEQAVPGAYTWEPANTWENLSNLPGWTLSTGGEWNGTACIFAGDDYAGDGDLRPEEDMQYLHLRGYHDNGWTNINAAQIVKNLVQGRQYTLDFVIAHNWAEGINWTPDPDFGVVVSEVDGENAGRLIMEQKCMGDGQDWEYFSYQFTAPATEIHLNFYLGNSYYEGNTHEDHWMDLDLVRVYSEEGDEPNPNAGVNTIIDTNAPVRYFNLQGIEVANPTEGQLLIKKQGNKSEKMVF